MIKSKPAFFSAFIILGICMYMFFPFPNNAILDAQATFMSFPIQDQDGYHLFGIIGSILFIIAIILLFISLKKYQFRTVIVVVIVYAFLPSLMITTYQETAANGIEAISYNSNGRCDFKMLDKTMDAKCNLVLHNRSNEDVSFKLEFIDSFFMEDEMRMESLMNIAGPYLITVEANSKKTIHITELIDLSDVPNHIDSGTSYSIHIKLISGNKARIL
ncbi:MAG: hypothetical protein ACQEV0_09295 [Bacillota bacterium]